MICAVIKGPSIAEAINQLERAQDRADMVELRLDYFTVRDADSLKKLRLACSVPMIFTLRTHLQGGQFQEPEDKRQSEIRKLAALNPEYFDLESTMPADFIHEIAQRHPEIKLILSYHDFSGTPENLPEIYNDMKQIPAAFYKIAVQATQVADTMRLLCWAQTTPPHVIALSMGSHGQISRIIGPMIGNPLTYASINDQLNTAPGQLTLDDLENIYHYNDLNAQSGVYGLIGDPVYQSIGHRTHNALIQECGLNAVYVKMQVQADELETFLRLARQLPFRGLSVTMPLKEAIIPYLDALDPQAAAIGAVNTLLFEKGRITGYNTDGTGALRAIEQKVSVKGKRMVLIGAGGAAKAVAYEACRKGAHVTIINRTEEKGQIIADAFHCTAKGIGGMKACWEAGYDILVNCTPLQMPIDPEYILEGSLVMDIKTSPKMSTLLEKAKEKGCDIICGYHMFVEQAVDQFALWFNGHITPQTAREILEHEALKVEAAIK